MKDFHLIVIGKLKDKNLIALESDYHKRINFPKLYIHECKGHKENIDLEVKELLNKVESIKAKHGKQHIVALTEHGKTFTSDKLSHYVYETMENRQCGICFLIGGAAGFPKDFLKAVDYQLSLSPMTFPHKIARLVFVEQLYRAQTIKQDHPYHKN